MSFHPNEIARRGRLASLGLIAVFGILGARFFSMQILQHAQYVLLSDQNRLNEVPIPAARGIIYDRNGAIIAENRPGYTVSILAPRAESLQVTLTRLAKRIPITPQQRRLALRRHDLNPNRPTVVFLDAAFDIVSVLEEHRVEFPGLIIQSSPKRYYPDSAAVSGFIGYIREISEAELGSERGIGYKAGQQIGVAGLERQYESVLRGQEGSRFVEVDSRQRVVRDAGVRTALAPVAGPPLQTNIDLDLQRFVANIFGDSLIGAAVVMDPTTGAVLALHSAPGYNPNRFIGHVPPAYYDSLMKDPRKPMFNKAIQGTYAPGSTWKLATAIIALEHNAVKLGQYMPERCTGGFRMGNRVWRCWDRHGHGSLDLIGAIKHSCDVYFYQLGQRIGFQTLVTDARRMLFGDAAGIDLPSENASGFPQSVPTVKAYMDSAFGRNWGTPQSELLNMSIGQGHNSQTPLNMARFYTALATDGQAATPRLVQTDTVRTRLFQISPALLDSLRLAMTEVVSAGGTAAGSVIRGIVLAGKTGTAQNPHGPDHGWFVGFAPADKPKVVVAVMIEFGLHGSRAARIASKITERYLKVSIGLPPVTGD